MGKEIKTIAVIGASTNRRKYGNIILRDLARKGYDVIPVNPAQKEVEGLPVVSQLSDLPKETDLLIFVVPAFVGIDMAREAIALGFTRLWFQPGAESGEIIRLLDSSEGIAGRYHDCVMLKTFKQGDLEM
jgi:predicted CoA-binding protein